MRITELAKRLFARFHRERNSNDFWTVFTHDGMVGVRTDLPADWMHLALEPLTWELNKHARLDIGNAEGYLLTVCAGTDATLAEPNQRQTARRRCWRIERDGQEAVCSADAINAIYTAAEFAKYGPTRILFAEDPGSPWKWCLLAMKENSEPERSEGDGQGRET